MEALEGRQLMSITPITSPPKNLFTMQTFTVTNINDSGAGSLRAAIQGVDASTATFDTINFSIGYGAQTISSLSALPQISRQVTVDATTQPGYAGTPLIQLNGAHVIQSPSVGSTGLMLLGNYDSVTGLNVRNYTTGIALSGSKGDLVQGNTISPSVYAGSLYTGATFGIELFNTTNSTVTGNQVTGATVGVCVDTSSTYDTVTSNNISQSVMAGIEVQGCFNTISSNIIGSGSSGAALGGVTYGSGIIVTNLGNSILNNSVGRARFDGIFLEGLYARDTTVQGNTVYDCSGTGIDVQGDYNTIEKNTVEYNGSYAIQLENNADFNTVSGNQLIGNADNWVFVASGAVQNTVS